MGNGNLTCSVIMTTYNGQQFIEKQLHSLFMQTRPPDEVLISDDSSVDDTVEIVDAFIADNHLEYQWDLQKNKYNKGVLRNFLDTAAQARGDVVFFADCDDVWMPEKIEMMMGGFEMHRDMLACTCLDYLIDGQGKKITSWYGAFARTSAGKGNCRKMTFADAVKYNQSAGHNLAVRRDFLAEAAPFILRNGLTFDLPIGTLAAIYDGYYLLGKELVAWRQHGENSSGLKSSVKERLFDFSGRVDAQKQRLRQMQAVYDAYSKQLSPEDRRTLEVAIDMTVQSINYLERKDSVSLFWMLFRRNRMVNWWISLNNFVVCVTNL